MISEGLASQGAQEDRLRGQHGPDEPMHTPRKVDHIVAAWTTSRRIEAIAHGSVMMSSEANQMPNSARVSNADKDDPRTVILAVRALRPEDRRRADAVRVQQAEDAEGDVCLINKRSLAGTRRTERAVEGEPNSIEVVSGAVMSAGRQGATHWNENMPAMN